MEPPNYTQQLLLQLNQQRSKGYLCDIIIVVENALFRAHKNVLAACSSYFKYLVLHENLITLNTEMVNPSVFNQVLDFIYTGQLPSSSHFSDQVVSELLRAASYLQLSDLAAVCHLKLKTSESKTWTSSTTSSFSTKQQQQISRNYNHESLEDGKSQRRGDVSEEEVFTSIEIRKSGSTPSSSSSSSSDDLPLNSTSAFSNPTLEQWYPMIDWQTAAQKRPAHSGEDCLEGSVQTKGKEVEHEGLIQAELEDREEEGLVLKRELEKSESGTEDEEVKGNKYSGYVYHQQLQSSAYDSSYLCIPCGKGFTSSEQLIAHVDSHKTEDPEEEQLLRMQDQYSESLPSRSSKEEPKTESGFSCSVCGKIYVDAAMLNHHKRSHSLTRSFSCDVCGKLFTQRGTMTRHMRSHLGIKPFACEECGMRFTRQYRKMEHMRIHSREKPYQCQLCGVRFTHQRSIISHLKMHAMVS
ncbi:hypermethylated in cancer 2 protein [Cheilinus undulatus]|uniref:hypermethylated in cancer 2 protein n=1 Tax=Cheilinus undulatus TaxID=241271 RepID=UPI001BD249B7|nr:hypermethylated in cancer 2 protein [Cheilinus undulatus]